MTKYFVTLSPIDRFFFSQENKYRKENNTYKADYFQRSSFFPQQTAIMGMLRYFLLQINGQIPINDEKYATELIGEQSFRISKEEFNFGKIKSISPVFIINKEQKNIFMPNPKDLILKDDEVKQLVYTRDEQIISNTSKNGFLLFHSYKEKEGLSDFLIDISDQSNYLNYVINLENNGIFYEIEKIGIEKGKDGQTKEESFYKQIVYKLKKNYAFCFITELDDSSITLPEEDIVVLGAERNSFKISFTKDSELISKIENIKIEEFNSPKIVAISDIYYEGDIYEYVDFAITETKPFRFLETKVSEETKYCANPLDKEEKNFKRSERYNLIKRGSVFYFKDYDNLNKFIEKLEEQKNFRKIGYNHYIKI